MIASGMNLVMTVIGFGGSTLFIVFVCTRLICARIHLNATRRSFPISSRSDLNMLERGLHGIESWAVANFPTKKYSEGLFSASEDAQCTVCLAEYQEQKMLRILPYCGHSFHVTCIDLWLKQHSTCPVCRISLRESPDKKAQCNPCSSSAIHSQFRFETPDNQSYNFSLGRHSGLPLRIPGGQVTGSTQQSNCLTVPAPAEDATGGKSDYEGLDKQACRESIQPMSLPCVQRCFYAHTILILQLQSKRTEPNYMEVHPRNALFSPSPLLYINLQCTSGVILLSLCLVFQEILLVSN